MSNNMNMQLDHIVYWVADIEKTSHFLTDIVGFRRHPMEIGVSDDDPTTGGMEGVFFDGNGLWLELIKPTTPGSGIDILDKVGTGAIVEINFKPEDYDAVLAEMKQKSISMLNMDGTPLNDDGGLIKEGVGTGDEIEHTGQRIAYWPTDLTRGTTIEIFEVIEGNDEGLIDIRDKQWQNEPKASPGTPRVPWVSHIAIFCKDLGTSAKFYTDILGLKRSAKGIRSTSDDNEKIGGLETAFFDAKGVWLELVEPKEPGLLMDILEEKGDGYIAELCLQIDDLDAYSEKLKAKGVQMVNIDGSPLDSVNGILQPYGDKIAYFPEEVSEGMVIEVIERGPNKESSALPNWER